MHIKYAVPMLFLLAQLAVAQDAPPSEAPAEEEAAEEAAAAELAAQAEAAEEEVLETDDDSYIDIEEEDFKPSEELPTDQSIDFPTDI